MGNEFIGYVGSPDIHDGIIMNLEQEGEKVRVTIKTDSGQTLIVTLDGVRSVKSNRPIGMMLYSMSEMKHPKYRLFSFTNWEEEDDAFLEIIAESFSVEYS